MNLPIKKFSALIFCGVSLAAAATLARGQGELLPIEPQSAASTGAPNQAEINEREYLRRAAGLTALRGSGLVVTLRDRQGVQVRDVSRPIPGLVHDYDLFLIANQLRAAGAEAISINGVRLGNQTAITVSGPSIYVGGQKISNPFKVVAVGDAGRMKNRLATFGIAKTFQDSGPQMNVATSKEVRVPALKQMPEFRFGKSE